jgi:hypothetical protein
VASTTPKPVVCRPGSMPRMRMDFIVRYAPKYQRAE